MVAGFRQATSEVTVSMRRLDDVVAETGDVPTIVKIDVETYEPAVLAGASDTLAAHRPHVIVEVLHRSNRDLGAPIDEVFTDLGYFAYALDATPDWIPQDRIVGRRGNARDWLLAPEPLDEAFVERWKLWHERYLRCDLAANPRPPIVPSIRRAFERGGGREIIDTGFRFLRRELIPSGLRSTKQAWSRVTRRGSNTR